MEQSSTNHMHPYVFSPIVIQGAIKAKCWYMPGLLEVTGKTRPTCIEFLVSQEKLEIRFPAKLHSPIQLHDVACLRHLPSPKLNQGTSLSLSPPLLQRSWMRAC
jgi:hypothetical protein